MTLKRNQIGSRQEQSHCTSSDGQAAIDVKNPSIRQLSCAVPMPTQETQEGRRDNANVVSYSVIGGPKAEGSL